MTTLRFAKANDPRLGLSMGLLALSANLEQLYDTLGHCTHVARTLLGETALAYPLVDGSRLVLVLPDGATLEDEPDEWQVPYTDTELEAGVAAGVELR